MGVNRLRLAQKAVYLPLILSSLYNLCLFVLDLHNYFKGIYRYAHPTFQ